MTFSFQDALTRLTAGEIVRPVSLNTTGTPNLGVCQGTNLGVRIATDAAGKNLESAPLQICRAWSDGTVSVCGCLLFRMEYAQCEWETVPTLPNPGLHIMPTVERVSITPPPRPD